MIKDIKLSNKSLLLLLCGVCFVCTFAIFFSVERIVEYESSVNQQFFKRAVRKSDAPFFVSAPEQEVIIKNFKASLSEVYFRMINYGDKTVKAQFDFHCKDQNCIDGIKKHQRKINKILREKPNLILKKKIKSFDQIFTQDKEKIENITRKVANKVLEKNGIDSTVDKVMLINMEGRLK